MAPVARRVVWTRAIRWKASVAVGGATDAVGRILFEQSPDGLVLLDGAGRVVAVNVAARQLLGPHLPIVGERLLEVLVAREWQWGDGRPLHTGDALLGAAFAGQRPADEPVLAGPATGERRRFFSLGVAPTGAGDGAGGGAVVVVRDVTAQRLADQERDAFLSLIAHEVKSPLTAITGFAQLARRAIGDESPAGQARVARHLRVIEQQVTRLSRLMDDLSTANRLGRGTLRFEPVRCDLAALVRAAIEQHGAAQESHRIALAVAAEPLPVLADPLRLDQLLANLLLNAARYSPQADRVAVELGSDGANAHLAVRDWGIGIPAPELGRIFDRFYRASNSADHGFGGLGLGLYLSRAIVARSGGAIWAEPAPGGGTTFRVTLPLAPDDPSDAVGA